MSYKCESASRRFQPGEGPSRGLLHDCTTSPINRYAALYLRGLADVAGLVNPPEQEPALPVVVVPAELHQQRLLIQADPPLSGLVDLNTAILLSSFTS